MTKRQARILLAKLGQGYDKRQLELAKALSRAGFEVVYTDLQDPVAIAESALQEAVDHIGITVLSTVSAETFRLLRETLKDQNAEDITVSAGGTIDKEAFDSIYATGVAALFPQGTTIDQLVAWARDYIRPTTPAP